MKVTAIKTHKITTEDKDILAILDQYVPKIEENSIVAVTSKIIAITEGNVVKAGEINKEDLAEQESEYYLPKETNKYGFTLSIKNGTFIASAGIDETKGKQEGEK